jgi:hypothetical protein
MEGKGGGTAAPSPDRLRRSARPSPACRERRSATAGGMRRAHRVDERLGAKPRSPRRRRRRAERAKEDLGGEQSPWKDRAIRRRQRRGIATDSSAEQGLEVGHSAVERAGVASRKRASHRRAKPSPAQESLRWRQGVRSEQPAFGSGPGHGPGLASAAPRPGSSDPGSGEARGRDGRGLRPQAEAARRRGASSGARAARLRPRGSLPWRHGRARCTPSGVRALRCRRSPRARGSLLPSVDERRTPCASTGPARAGGARPAVEGTSASCSGSARTTRRAQAPSGTLVLRGRRTRSGARSEGKRQGGNGRGDAVRLLTRGILRRV